MISFCVSLFEGFDQQPGVPNVSFEHDVKQIAEQGHCPYKQVEKLIEDNLAGYFPS